MTNAEKYLKDGVDVDGLSKQIATYLIPYYKLSDTAKVYEDLVDFFRKHIKPTLSEDEKVILRNLCHWIIKIGRYDNEICLIDEEDLHEELWYLQDGLFSFIQERRRI